MGRRVAVVMAGLSRKYVVFKAEDWDRWVTALGEVPELHTYFREYGPNELDDAVVLRKQDVFTSSALYEYAGQIRTTVEIIEKLLARQESPEVFLHGLRELANSFTEEAEDAEVGGERKLPD